MRKWILLLFLSLLMVGTAGWAWAGSYVIGAGDVLKVSVWGVPELSVQITVRPDGKITLPAAGDVVAAGMEPARLGRELTHILGRFVKKPIVTVTVEKITNNRIYLSGGGVTPQVIDLPRYTSLFRLLCSVPDIQKGDLRHAYVVRDGKKIFSNFYDLFNKGAFSEDIELKPDDIVFIPSNEPNKIYVTGAVNAPKYIVYRQGLKLLDAILEAGGFNKYAKESNVIVIRKNNHGGLEKLRVNMKDVVDGDNVAKNILLKPEDYVVVRESLF